MEHKKYSQIGNLVWSLRKQWRLDRHFVFFVFALVPVGVALPLVNSYWIKALIDAISSGWPFSRLILLAAGFMMIVTCLTLLEKYLQSRCDSRAYYSTEVYQTEMDYMHCYQTDYENTERQEYQKIYNYAKVDATSGNCVLEWMWPELSKGLTHFVGSITYVSLLVMLDPILLGVVAITSCISYFSSRWQAVYYEKHKHLWEKEVRKKNYFNSLSEDFSKAKEVKLYGMAPWLEKMMRDYQSYIFMWNKRCNLRGLWAAILAGFMSLLQNGATYIVLITSMLNGHITVGEFVFYFGIVGSIISFLQGVISSVAKIHTDSDKIAYYRAYYDYPNQLNHGEGCALPTAPVKIELRDVWYRYDGAEDYTLKGINLCIEKGESLALVGMNGAGKTTLIKLICGLYTPTRGEVLVGGKRIKEYNIEEYYSLISAVFQEIHPVAFTIFEFITSVDPEHLTAREEAIGVMKAAGIYEKIQSLPNGMDTHLVKGIYDDGVDLSGGEMQKLVLARAIYKNGAILILDEPTAALDPIAENNLYLQYRALTKGKTSIYISHRFASTRFCDRIILLEAGRILESGTHEELMKQNGQYAYMFGVQSQYYQEGEVNA